MSSQDKRLIVVSNGYDDLIKNYFHSSLDNIPLIQMIELRRKWTCDTIGHKFAIVEK